MLGGAAGLEPATAGLLITAVDLVSGALLVGVAGVTPADAAAVLVDLWCPGGGR